MMEKILENYSLEVVNKTAEYGPYIFKGPKGAVLELWRNAVKPWMLFVINRRTMKLATVCGVSWFADGDATTGPGSSELRALA